MIVRNAQVLEAQGQKVTKAEVQDLLDEIDSNNDGKVRRQPKEHGFVHWHQGGASGRRR